VSSDASGSINRYADATGVFLSMVTTLNAAKVTDTFRRLLDVSADESTSLRSRRRPGPRD
jgi:xylulokinase